MKNTYIKLFVILVILYFLYFIFSSKKQLGVSKLNKKNILGTNLIPCSKSYDKVTGYYRDGMCSTGNSDTGTHVVCAIVDDKFLKFTKSKGNDLITPRDGFPGLVNGDKWCLCILRWIEALKSGNAPKIIAKSTNEIAEKYIDKKILLKYAV